jgi:uncharacterized protein YggT (Ycf19 family)
MSYAIGRIIILLITIYWFMLILRIILSWINIPHSRWVYWLCKFTDPVIDFFRRNFPIRIGAIDLSIATPLILLSILGKLTTDFMIGNEPFNSIFNIWYILTLLVYIVKFLYNFVLFVLIFLVFILLIAKLLAPNVQNPFISGIRSFLNPMLDFLDRLFKIKSTRSDIIYLIILLLFFIIINGLGSFLLDYANAIFHAFLLESKKQVMILEFYCKVLV